MLFRIRNKAGEPIRVKRETEFMVSKYYGTSPVNVHGRLPHPIE
jgi:hypothetical protein